MIAESVPVLMIVELAENGRLVPVTASTRASPVPGLVELFTEANEPPMTTELLSGVRASANTLPPWMSGAHGSRPPSEARTAATRVRALLGTDVTRPPKYTVSFVTASARTRASGRGWKVLIKAPEVGFTATMRFLVSPLTAVKSPPM